VLTPQGRVARYFYGVEYAPRDLRFGLIEASENRIGSPVDQLMLYCFQYDPSTGRYSTAVLGAVRAAGVLTVAAFAAFFIWSRRRERAAPQRPADVPRPGAGAPPALPERSR
jgi:protein SCO1/2